MLECPLYDEPDLYDRLFNASADDPARRARIEASERFYLDEVRRCGPGPVLDLACGSGRITIPLARQGVEITGADLSPSMLERARTKAGSAGLIIPFLPADLRGFQFNQRFAAILISGNSLLHLQSVPELRRCFQCVRDHLLPHGRLLFDIAHWDLFTIAGTARQRRTAINGETSVEEIASYDAATQVRHITWFFSTTTQRDFRVIEYSLRVIYPQELILLLESSGFTVRERYGEFTRQPFEHNSPRQVCVCEIS
ncbi:MAG: class I SAM-dependent methyltransferase [Acidobacteriaceae bacterium]|nr:class I SAM-dependent methyltransferase [Acidobacteriaceae bacterium]